MREKNLSLSTISSLLLLLAFAVVIVDVAEGVSIDMNMYMGCFQVNPLIKNYFTYPALPDEISLTPTYCIRACNSINYKYAVLEATTRCYCTNFNESYSIAISDNTCSSLCSTQQLVCPGDWSKCCGSSSFYLLYKTVPVADVSILIFQVFVNSINLII
jgi:hypothetical protein